MLLCVIKFYKNSILISLLYYENQENLKISYFSNNTLKNNFFLKNKN